MKTSIMAAAVVALLTTCTNKTGGKENAADVPLALPSDMTLRKRAEKFRWYSDRWNDNNHHIVVYAYTGDRVDAEEVIRKRDSVMQQNIKGENDSMYVRTVKQGLQQRKILVNGDSVTEFRGSWEMTNDAMGGPFISHVRRDKAHRIIIVAEGFVYAPGHNKEAMLQRIENILRTYKAK